MRKRKRAVKRHLVNVSAWTHHHLLTAKYELRERVNADPERYGSLSSRCVTLNDLIYYLARRFLDEAQEPHS